MEEHVPLFVTGWSIEFILPWIPACMIINEIFSEFSKTLFGKRFICKWYTLCVWSLHHWDRFHFNMMTSSNGNIFRVTGPLCGEFTCHRCIPLTKASDAELWCFLWSAPWINGWVNNREAGDLRRHRAHYDVIVMSSVTQVIKCSRMVCALHVLPCPLMLTNWTNLIPFHMLTNCWKINI